MVAWSDKIRYWLINPAYGGQPIFVVPHRQDLLNNIQIPSRVYCIAHSLKDGTVFHIYSWALQNQVGLRPGRPLDNGPQEGDYSAWVA